MRDGHEHCRRHLRVCPEVLDSIIVAVGARVDGGEVFGLEGDAVAGDTLQQPEFEVAEEAVRVEEGEVLGWG